MVKILRVEGMAANLVTYSELRDRGRSKAKIARMRRSKSIDSVWNGVYVEPPIELKYPESVHQLRAAGFLLKSKFGWTLSHWSAAIMHGLPGWNLPLDKVAVTAHSSSVRSHSTATTYRKSTALPADEVTIISGFKVTIIERTLLDIATTCSFAAAVVAIESALYHHRTSREALEKYFRSKRNLNNLPVVLKALAFASSASQSVLESRSRLFFNHFGLPMLEQQVVITTRSGRQYRVDFLWRGLKLIGEADGTSKLVGGTEREQWKRIRAQRDREEELRAEGYTFVRWGWNDLAKPVELNTRLESAFAQAQRLVA